MKGDWPPLMRLLALFRDAPRSRPQNGYRMLREMLDAGLLVKDGKQGKKNVYRITPAGRGRLQSIQRSSMDAQ